MLAGDVPNLTGQGGTRGFQTRVQTSARGAPGPSAPLLLYSAVFEPPNFILGAFRLGSPIIALVSAAEGGHPECMQLAKDWGAMTRQRCRGRPPRVHAAS